MIYNSDKEKQQRFTFEKQERVLKINQEIVAAWTTTPLLKHWSTTATTTSITQPHLQPLII